MECTLYYIVDADIGSLSHFQTGERIAGLHATRPLGQIPSYLGQLESTLLDERFSITTDHHVSLSLNGAPAMNADSPTAIHTYDILPAINKIMDSRSSLPEHLANTGIALPSMSSVLPIPHNDSNTNQVKLL